MDSPQSVQQSGCSEMIQSCSWFSPFPSLGLDVMDVAGPANGQSFLFKPKNTLRFEDEGRQSRD